MNLSKVVEISFALAGKCRHTKRCRHYSFIFQNKKLLSIGMNSPKTHPLNLKYNYINKQKANISDVVGTHSELSSVIKLGYQDCSGLVMVNTRINRNNKLDYSFPCNGCMEMIKKLNFDKVVYSNKEGKFSCLNMLSSQGEFSR
jgi:deoxycytidylate deaminase